MFFDCTDHHFISFKNLKITFYYQNYTTQGDYVIFDFNYATVELDIEEITKSCKDYDSLKLELIDEPSIIIHRKYIHKLKIDKVLEHILMLEPTQSLSLDVTNEYAGRPKYLISYLKSHSFEKLDVEAKYSTGE